MKKRIFIIGMVLALVLTWAPGAVLAAKTITLRMAHFIWEKPGFIGGAVEKYFAEEVTKRTNGRVKIQIYWAGQLGQTKELLELCSNGTVDLVAVAQGYFPKQFPLWRAPNSIPFVMTNVRQAVEVARQLPKKIPALQEEFTKNNVKYMYAHGLAPYQLFAKKPVTKIEDFKGLRCRTWGFYLPRAYKAVGAVGVSVFPTEAYEAIKRGVTDAQMWHLNAGHILKMYEVAKHVNQWNIMTIVGWNVLMNLDVWKKLDAETQKIVMEVAEECYEVEYKRATGRIAGAGDFIKSKGGIFHEISAAERQRWIDACPDFMAEWVDENTKAGKGEAAQQMRDLWLKIVDQYK